MIDGFRILRKLSGQIGRFRRDQRGTMAMMAGLAAIPLIFSVGAGVDYGVSSMAKTKLDEMIFWLRSHRSATKRGATL